LLGSTLLNLSFQLERPGLVATMQYVEIGASSVFPSTYTLEMFVLKQLLPRSLCRDMVGNNFR